MKISDLTRLLEQWAPLCWQESYDNAGLILGQAQEEVEKILLCTDLTPSIVEEAIEKKAQLIISHHPPIFYGIKKINTSSPMARMLHRSLQNNLAWYTMHTNLDNAIDGVNAYWADCFKLSHRQVLEPRDPLDQKQVGAGLCGTLAQELSETELLDLLKKEMKTSCIRHSGFQNRRIQKIAFCGGSGDFLQNAAQKKGAQVLITAEIKYHSFVNANPHLWLIDVGHFESEQYTKNQIAHYLNQHSPQLETLLSENDLNPVCYF